MSKHTPGPWKVGKSEGNGIVCFVGSVEVATTTNEDPLMYDLEADARLISKAPELLDALQMLVKVSEQKGVDCRLQKQLINDVKGEQQ